MKQLLFLFVLVAQLAEAQPTPVYFMGHGNVETDTALWRKHKLRSATVTQIYNDSMVIAYFETDSLYRPVVQLNKNTLTHSTYRGNRLATQAVHKNVYFGYLHVPHEIDSLSYIYLNDSTVVITKKEYQLGSTRNHRNTELNEKWYLLRWEDFDWGGVGVITYSYAYFTRFPSYMYWTYPNGGYRVPSYENQYVLDTKFKTNYTDTALYCIRESEEVRVNDSTISLTETVVPDVAFTPPARLFQPYGSDYMNYHPSYSNVYSTTESKYDDNGLLTAIESKTYRRDDGEFSPKSTLISSETLYRFSYTYFDR